MLVSVSPKKLTMSKKDKDLSHEESARHNASEDSFSVSKRLFNSEAAKALNKIAGEAIVKYRSMTLPYTRGQGMLKATAYLSFMEKMNELRRRYLDQKERFLDNLDQSINESIKNLGTAYRAEDYPTREVLEERLTFDIEVFPMPAAANWLINLAEEEQEALRKNLEESITKKVEGSRKETVARLVRLVELMANNLSEPDKVFRKSMLSNISEMCDQIPDLNVGDDPDLNHLAKSVKTRLAGYEAESLRKDPEVRKQAAEEAKKTLETLKEYA
jgi:hypothetical protein